MRRHWAYIPVTVETFKDTKALVLDGVRLAREGLAVVTEAVPTLQPEMAQIERALTPDLYATDEAFRLVTEEGMSFRDAYVQVGNNLADVPVPDHEELLRRRSHIGSTGNLGLHDLRERIMGLRENWAQRGDQLHRLWQDLLQPLPAAIKSLRFAPQPLA